MVAHESWPHVVMASFVYAKCIKAARRSLWLELQNIAHSNSQPWSVGGDFSVISTTTNYIGTATQDLGAISNFNKAISNCDLQELPYSGSSFMWTGIKARLRVWKCLDRCLTNQQWMQTFSNLSVQHLNRATLDHNPLLLTPQMSTSTLPWPSKFQNMRILHPSYLDVIQDS